MQPVTCTPHASQLSTISHTCWWPQEVAGGKPAKDIHVPCYAPTATDAGQSIYDARMLAELTNTSQAGACPRLPAGCIVQHGVLFGADPHQLTSADMPHIVTWSAYTAC